MSTKANLHRETLRAAIRVIQTSETLEQARIQLARMLNIFDKLEKAGRAAMRPSAKPRSDWPPAWCRRRRAPTSSRSGDVIQANPGLAESNRTPLR